MNAAVGTDGLWLTLGAALGVAGLLLALWAIFSDRSRGRLRCPRCWYDRSGGPEGPCPECGHTARSERALRRTRRQWRWAIAGCILLLAGLGSAAFPVLRSRDPWSFAPDWLVIAALPSHRTGNEPLARQFRLRQYRYLPPDPRVPRFSTGPGSIRSDLMSLDQRIVGDLSPRRARQLGERALRSLERNPAHPFKTVLLPALAVLPADPGRVERLFVPMLDDPSPEVRASAIRALGNARPHPGLVIPLLASRIETLVWPGEAAAPPPAPPFGLGVGPATEVALMVEAIGRYGAEAVAAVPLLVRLLEGEWPEHYWISGELNRYICDALMTIGPAAAEALPALERGPTRPDWHASLTSRLEARLVLSGAAKDKTDALVQLTRHADSHVRRGAFTTLMSDAPDPMAYKTTGLALLNDESDYVSMAAAQWMLAKGVARDECRDFLLKTPDRGGVGGAWTKVQILQQHGFDARPLLPQLEAEKAAQHLPQAVQNYQNLIDAVRAGRQFR